MAEAVDLKSIQSGFESRCRYYKYSGEKMKLPKRQINESSLSRILSHIESDRSFGVVSSFRGDLSRKENMDRHAELKNLTRQKGYGFIEMRGGYKEEDGGFVNELSLFIPKVSKKDIMELGTKFDQDSIIYKDKDSFELVGTNRATGRGKVLMNFRGGGPRDSVTLAKDAMKDFFSSLLKGSQRGKKFLFQTEDVILEEKENLGFNQVAYLNNKPRWFTF